MHGASRCVAVLWLIALLAPLVCGAEVWRDAFDYPDGSAGEPAWLPDSDAWMVAGGRLTFEGGPRNFAVWDKTPEGRSASLEATVQVDARRGDGWALAGVAIRHDDANFWHLALVASPAAEGGRRYAELSEACQGAWNAQGTGPTALRRTADEGADFAWQLGQPYRMSIRLSPDGIEGTVTTMDGKLLRRIGYAFDAGKPAARSGRPALDAALLSSWFDDATAQVSDPLPPPPAAALPAYNVPGFDAVHGRASGFFHAENLDGKWWLIDPNGLGFYAVGADQVSYSAHWCQKLGYAPYHRNVEAKYGSEEKWAGVVASRLHAWGFNTLGESYSDYLRHTHFAHIEWFGAGPGFADVDDIVPRTTWTGFPNVFSPRWKRHCETLARHICAPNPNDPWLLGYCLDGELQWFGALDNWEDEAGLFTETWRKPASNTAKQAWMGVVRERCPTVADFNAAWGTKFGSFDELAASTAPVVPPTDAARQMARQYVRLVAELYFKTAADAIHRYDPNHMVLSCLFAGWAPDVLDIVGKYCDVICLDSYPRIDAERGVPQSLVDQYRTFSGKTGRPLFITEWSFPAMDSGLPNLHGAGMRVATQEQRARCFRLFQSTLFGLPFLVGSNFFMYVDEPALGISDSFPEDSNYGLVKENDDPWADLVAAATAVNKQADELHQSGALQYVYTPAPGWTRPVPSDRGPMAAQSASANSGPLAISFDPSHEPALLLRFGGAELGRFYPLLHQKAPADVWRGPDAASIDSIRQDDDFTVIEMTFRHTPAAAEAAGTPAYAAGWRFWFPINSSGWFGAQSLWVENTDSRPWTLAGLYEYTRPSIGGSPDGDVPATPNVPDFYLPLAAWEDPAAGLGQGVVTLDDALKVTYWKNKDGCHSDCRQELNVPLAPGQRYAAEGPVALIFGYRTGGAGALLRAADRVRAEALALQPKPTAK